MYSEVEMKDNEVNLKTTSILKVWKLVKDLNFAPFEDVLGIGHAAGFSSILIPGHYANFYLLFSTLKPKSVVNILNVQWLYLTVEAQLSQFYC